MCAFISLFVDVSFLVSITQISYQSTFHIEFVIYHQFPTQMSSYFTMICTTCIHNEPNDMLLSKRFTLKTGTGFHQSLLTHQKGQEKSQIAIKIRKMRASWAHYDSRRKNIIIVTNSLNYNLHFHMLRKLPINMIYKVLKYEA